MNSHSRLKFVAGILWAIFAVQSVQADITDFTTWTQVQDPAHANFTSSVNAAQATLFAGNGHVPDGTDIGYQTVNGQTPATSNAGHAFDPAGDFTVAIDFNLSFANNPDGALAIGFGIGEDRDGVNSAGAVMFTNDGSPFLFFAGNARVDDVDQGPQAILVGASLSGSLFASYDASSGDVTLGASQTPGAAGPTGSTTFSAIQNSWAGGFLLASFFLRSDDAIGDEWQSGNGQAVFSNFRSLNGEAIAVPEPGVIALLPIAAAALSRGRKPIASRIAN
jgi:hypothetical protein